MKQPTQLTPISYHLRNFNKYVCLDLDAAQFGNLTLVGENAAGKTTLANCFFPMLIDGSIATPSFNPAKGTDKVAKTGHVRNSQQDTRTFDSMLLGWGPSAMKVRTGYSYLLLKSSQRQVILGIGAQRISGAAGTTWWFVAMTTVDTDSFTIVTTNGQGVSLDLGDFKQANQDLGDQLHIFKTAAAYREFVATRVYGFAHGEALEQLANVYRLLASPILTGGNAKFSPIKVALRDAQARIDDSVIYAAASTQREVNRKNGLLKRIAQGQQRLKRIKNNVFWSNLNHLNELKLQNYTAIHAELEQDKEKVAYEQALIDRCNQLLNILVQQLQEAQAKVEQLNIACVQQQALKQRRQDLLKQINIDQERLKHFEVQQRQVQQQQEQLQATKTQLEQLVAHITALKHEKLTPLQTRLNGQSAKLTGLVQVLAQPNLTTVVQQFAHYLRQLKQQLTQYDNLGQQAHNLSQDVMIVNEMQEQMNTSIVRRTQGTFAGRLRDGLQQDNRIIHETGAAKMNTQFQQLKQQQAELLMQHPDVRVLLATPELLATLTDQHQQLADISQQLTELRQAQEKYQMEQDQLTTAVNLIRAAMVPNFDPALMRQQISRQQEQLKQLVIDEQLDTKLTAAKKSLTHFNNQKQELETKKSTSQGQLVSASESVQKRTEQLTILAAEIEKMLQVVAPYVSAGVELKTTNDVIAFVHAHGSEVRNHRYSEIADRIRRGIHRNDTDGIDRFALDILFTERGYEQIASTMYQGSREISSMTTLTFDINQAQKILEQEFASVTRAVVELKTGNELAKTTYLAAAVERISDQYQVIANYNQILTAGLANDQGIKLKVELRAVDIAPAAITEACDLFAEQRPQLEQVIQDRLNVLANDAEVADDDEQFKQRALALLDTRQWSEFHVLIKRRQSAADDFEEVDDKFVRSGGSGAEKAQAMVLPLLLVPKMLLQQSSVSDAPYLVMFDEFADKLDPETAKSFAKTITNFGFAFIATMPSGAQNKILADGVANVAYEVIAPVQQSDGKFHPNQVRPVLRWQQELAHE